MSLLKSVEVDIYDRFEQYERPEPEVTFLNREKKSTPFNSFLDYTERLAFQTDITEFNLNSIRQYSDTKFDTRPVYSIKRSFKPALPLKLKQKIGKYKKSKIKCEEMFDIINEIGKITEDFYRPKHGKFLAVRIDGVIVDSADTEIDLLLKVQGRKFNTSIFVWEAGSDSPPGWST